MSDWVALREQIRRDYFVIKKDHDRLLLACMLPYGKWYVRVQWPAAGAADLEVAVIVKNGADATAPAPRAANDNRGAELGRAHRYVVLRDKLAVAGLVYSELRRAIENLTAQAARVAFAMQPDEAIALSGDA